MRSNRRLTRNRTLEQLAFSTSPMPLTSLDPPSMWNLKRTLITSLFVALVCKRGTSSSTVRQGHVDVKITLQTECGRKTRIGDTISVHYNGTLEDGTLFDSSHNHDHPIAFALGLGEVIRGWDQGLLDMCVGDERTLTIPSSLAYGNRVVGAIPAGSTLSAHLEGD